LDRGQELTFEAWDDWAGLCMHVSTSGEHALPRHLPRRCIPRHGCERSRARMAMPFGYVREECVVVPSSASHTRVDLGLW
jgi:hypothetical protein